MTDTPALDEFVSRVRWFHKHVSTGRSLDFTTRLARKSLHNDLLFMNVQEELRLLDYWTPSKGMAEYRAKWFIHIDLEERKE